MFHIGQKVVCIGDFSAFWAEVTAAGLDLEMPKLGEVYTVRAVKQDLHGDDVCLGLTLHEIVNPVTRRTRAVHCVGPVADDDPRRLPDGEIAFAAWDFRPLISVEEFVATDRKEPVPA